MAVAAIVVEVAVVDRDARSHPSQMSSRSVPPHVGGALYLPWMASRLAPPHVGGALAVSTPTAQFHLPPNSQFHSLSQWRLTSVVIRTPTTAAHPVPAGTVTTVASAGTATTSSRAPPYPPAQGREGGRQACCSASGGQPAGSCFVSADRGEDCGLA